MGVLLVAHQLCGCGSLVRSCYWFVVSSSKVWIILGVVNLYSKNTGSSSGLSNSEYAKIALKHTVISFEDARYLDHYKGRRFP